MNVRYADRMKLAKASFIRESLKLASDKSIVSFAGGNPDSDYFPGPELRRCCSQVLNGDWKDSLQYNISEGYPPLREQLLKKMAAMGVRGGLTNLIVTSGSQQGLDLAAKLLIDEGDEIVVESPSYMGAINAFQYYGPRFLEVKMDSGGMDMDDLERILKEHTGVKFIYTIPDFHNPTGLVMELPRRKRLVELAEQYGALVLEDSPYYDIRFTGASLPPVKFFDSGDRVLYLGSMSKILCPGLRIGWIMGGAGLVEKLVYLKQAADLHTNELAQRTVAAYLQETDMSGRLKLLNRSYCERKEIMTGIIRDRFPGSVRFTDPQGGLFLWMELPDQYNAQRLFDLSLQKIKVIFVPGSTFYPYGGHDNTLRLSYSTVGPKETASGMNRLADLFREVIPDP